MSVIKTDIFHKKSVDRQFIDSPMPMSLIFYFNSYNLFNFSVKLKNVTDSINLWINLINNEELESYKNTFLKLWIY